MVQALRYPCVGTSGQPLLEGHCPSVNFTDHAADGSQVSLKPKATNHNFPVSIPEESHFFTDGLESCLNITRKPFIAKGG